MFNIIARKTLLSYCKKYPEAESALLEWYHEIIAERFLNFNDLKKKYGSASLVGDDRVVFNVLGNKFRLVVRVVFEFKTVQVKWFGTHKEYNEIDVKKINHKKK